MWGHDRTYKCIEAGQTACPRQDSNLRTRLRRAVLYPLSYGGSATGKGYQGDDDGRRRGPVR
jgi:hypothetical protein